MKRSTPRPRGAPAIKMLITAASIAATLTGWAVLSEPLPVATTPVAAVANVAAPTAPPPAWLLSEPPIPTLVPVAVALASEPPIVSVKSNAPPAPTQPTLRDVTALVQIPATPPPQPVTRTRSSR